MIRSASVKHLVIHVIHMTVMHAVSAAVACHDAAATSDISQATTAV